jgi:hypothetical protein
MSPTIAETTPEITNKPASQYQNSRMISLPPCPPA